ncbi:heparan-alpha-glucosaminide N-acetyltransferase domain-containing protein [Sphingomonas sp. PsM26]|nr:heparan-alpha-glucosaminide N-acetyltransferase domain-containing protein [Sphingomonas sp. PsM26]
MSTQPLQQPHGDVVAKRPARFRALDQVRGLAIFCMILAHFGPGVYERLGIGGTPRAMLDLIGRLATPAFVLIFGITLAIIYVPKARKAPDATMRGLINRSGLVLLCSLIVSLHGTVNVLMTSDEPAFWFRLLLAQYSVLTFYTVAIFLTALAVRFIAQDPVRIGFLGGALLIFIGSVLGYEAFPFQGEKAIELVRLLFVSGKYGVFVMMGCAWLMIGVGVLIRNHLANGTSFHRDVMAIALGMALLGLSDGRVVGWRTLGDLASGYAAPPQFWYLAMVGGAMLSALVALDRYTVPVVGFVLERIGRYPLSIYVAHSLVLPGVALLRWAAPTLPETIGTVGCLLLFIGFCVYKVWASTAPDRARRTLAVQG